MDDLRGRRVGVGPSGSGAAVISKALLRGASAGHVREVDATVPQTTTMLLNRQLDAAFTISSVPNDDAREMMDGGARLLPIRGPDVDRLRTMYPFFRSEIIPAGAHREVDEPVNTLSVDVVLSHARGLMTPWSGG